MVVPNLNDGLEKCIISAYFVIKKMQWFWNVSRTKSTQEEDVYESHGVDANGSVCALRVCAWLVRWLDLQTNDIQGTPLACAGSRYQIRLFSFQCTTCWLVLFEYVFFCLYEYYCESLSIFWKMINHISLISFLTSLFLNKSEIICLLAVQIKT